MRTNYLVESGFLWRCLGLRGPRDKGQACGALGCPQGQPGLVNQGISAAPLPAGHSGAAGPPVPPSGLELLGHRVIRVIEFPPPGNLSDSAPHIFISA